MLLQLYPGRRYALVRMHGIEQSYPEMILHVCNAAIARICFRRVASPHRSGELLVAAHALLDDFFIGHTRGEWTGHRQRVGY